MKTYDEQGNEITSQDDEALNGEALGHDDQDDDAVGIFNEITTDSKDSIDDNDKVLDQEVDDKGETQADTQAATDDQGQAAEDDPWASVPEEFRNQFNQLQNNYRSLEQNHKANSGRVSALTKQLNQYKQSLKVEEKANGGSDASTGPTSDDLKGKSFEEVREEWPEIAEFVNAQVNQVEQRLAQRIDPLQQRGESQDQQAYINSQFEALHAAHPDFQQISNDPAFSQWVGQQGPNVQAMAQSDDADTNIDLLDLYKARRQPAAQAQVQTPAPAAKPKATPRNNALADHAELPRKGPGKAASEPDDVDSVDFYWKISS